MAADTIHAPKGPLVVFAGGGTGGHLYPALSVARVLARHLPGVRFSFYATERRIDEVILQQADCTLVPQHLPPLRKAPWTWPGTLMGLRRSGLHCRERFEEDPPLVVIGSGGLAAVAPIRQARRLGIPTALLNPDAIPGRANRLLSSIVDRVFVQWDEATSRFPRSARVQVTGCPVRSAFNDTPRERGIEAFGLDPGRKTLLITGASQGARTVNQAVVGCGEFLASFEDWQVLHLTGDRDHEMVVEGYGGRYPRVAVLAYTHLMPEALAAADLVVSRAGASTLAEITAVGRPSVLMPYPFHRDMHQLANARCLVRASAARIVTDRVDPAVNAPALRAALAPLMEDDAARLQMGSAASRIGRGDAASTVAHALLELTNTRDSLGLPESMERIA